MPRLRWAHHDPMLREQVVIERVERLAALQQHVVGHVDDIIDRTQPQSLQNLFQPYRARANLHAANQSRGVARTQVRRFNGDAYIVRTTLGY